MQTPQIYSLWVVVIHSPRFRIIFDKAQAQNTDAKLNAILKHLNISAPPPTAAATVTQPPLGSVAASAY